MSDLFIFKELGESLMNWGKFSDDKNDLIRHADNKEKTVWLLSYIADLLEPISKVITDDCNKKAYAQIDIWHEEFIKEREKKHGPCPELVVKELKRQKRNSHYQFCKMDILIIQPGHKWSFSPGRYDISDDKVKKIYDAWMKRKRKKKS